MRMNIPTMRLLHLDSIKGVLIVLVIIGHAIQFCMPDCEQNFCFRFIYSFHMPLFFFVSGYLANRGCYNSSVIGKRVYQLLIPLLYGHSLLLYYKPVTLILIKGYRHSFILIRDCGSCTIFLFTLPSSI